MKVEPILKSAAVRSRGASLILVFPTISLFLLLFCFVFSTWHYPLSTRIYSFIFLAANCTSVIMATWHRLRRRFVTPLGHLRGVLGTVAFNDISSPSEMH